MFNIESKFRKCKKKKKKKKKKKMEKIFLVSDINASGNVAINCVSEEENTCHQESMG